MKLLIDISEEKYEWIKTHNLGIDNDSIIGAIVNGIPYEERPQVECKDCKYFFDIVGRCDNCNRYHWYSDNFVRKQI